MPIGEMPMSQEQINALSLQGAAEARLQKLQKEQEEARRREARAAEQYKNGLAFSTQSIEGLGDKVTAAIRNGENRVFIAQASEAPCDFEMLGGCIREALQAGRVDLTLYRLALGTAPAYRSTGDGDGSTESYDDQAWFLEWDMPVEASIR